LGPGGAVVRLAHGFGREIRACTGSRSLRDALRADRFLLATGGARVASDERRRHMVATQMSTGLAIRRHRTELTGGTSAELSKLSCILGGICTSVHLDDCCWASRPGAAS
jgi:hypothetical protein